jgi:hypothetical protein
MYDHTWLQVALRCMTVCGFHTGNYGYPRAYSLIPDDICNSVYDL